MDPLRFVQVDVPSEYSGKQHKNNNMSISAQRKMN
jgi:hypothetical protein